MYFVCYKKHQYGIIFSLNNRMFIYMVWPWESGDSDDSEVQG